MKIAADYWIGLVLLVFSIVAFILAMDFPVAPGRPLGPGAVPMLVTGMLGVCAVVLLVQTYLRQRTPAALADAVEQDLEPSLPLLPRRDRIINAVLIIGAPIFYTLVVDRLGFLITAIVFVYVIALRLWGGAVRSAVLAAGTAVVADAIFRGVFGLPFPRGILQIPLW